MAPPQTWVSIRTGEKAMKKLIIASLATAQTLSAAPPAFAAAPDAVEMRQMGAFAGLRLRVPLDDHSGRHARVGLTVAPAMLSRTADGEARSRIAEGIELGFRGGRPLSLSLAGRDLHGGRLGAADGGDGGGVPTWALVAGGVVLVLGGAYLWFSEAIDCDEDEECS